MSYTADHLFMLVTTFELQQIGLPAERAILAVNTGWDSLKVGYGVAFDLQDRFEPIGEKILAQVFGRSLKELQFVLEPELLALGGARYARATTASAFASRLARSSSNRLSYSYVLLDLSDIFKSVRSACFNFGGVTVDEFGGEFCEWSLHKGGYIDGGHPLHPEKQLDVVD